MVAGTTSVEMNKETNMNEWLVHKTETIWNSMGSQERFIFSVYKPLFQLAKLRSWSCVEDMSDENLELIREELHIRAQETRKNMQGRA